ncbi:BZ3500_MvSof-1268-A1-R1_Chr3-3g06517 [Microbotryum saponariae]|uniref:BZ3500_MvSof-1268-A1-R1_Chr3-3g06517 protein n=1 Tax=Microbotryum saponariae TaxID=289078 RepID=A0A2X0LC00_9BASI|nr:BZ3500_MvSof-1268-A1-R1_Chr3-3g06517 [Microbotryum saponariae]SDA04484.1 BZ3501_MvSof-1269-A2-R1_Chr3-2g06204 [Microbotryum saponariae]
MWGTVALACIALRVLYLFYLHPLANIPGPRLAKITDAWKVYQTYKGTYTTTMRINRSSDRPQRDEIKTLYGHGTKWLKAVAAAYSTNHLLGLESFADYNTSKLFGYFDRAVAKNEVCDVAHLIEWFAYDTVSEISFGKPFGFLTSGEDTRSILPAFAKGTAFVVFFACSNSWGWVSTTRAVRWFVNNVLANNSSAIFVRYSTELVAERVALKENDPESFEEKHDMLSHFFNAVDPATQHKLGFSRLVRECSTLVIAGADTTKSTMLGFLRHIYDPKNAESLAKLRAEISTALEEGQLDFPVSYDQGSKLEYLQAAIKEATRMHPAVGMALQRVTPAGGAQIGPHFYPEGTLVGMSGWQVHYDPRAYGDDCEEWKPERWLDADGKSDLHKYNLAFGAGARVCLGKNISIMEMLKLLPSIVWHYDLTFENPDQPFQVNESWFAVPHDFHCRLRKRDV